jgi:hypothetical protein
MTLFLLADVASAQDEDEATGRRARVQRFDAELSDLRSRLEELERMSLDEQLRERRSVFLYGDIGFRYHMLFEGSRETFNRPEFRLHLGVYGTMFDEANQRLRFDLRLTTGARDSQGRPVPTLAWKPLPGYGANPELAVDRFQILYDVDRVLSGSLGRFPSPYAGTELLYDRDYNFQGISESVRFDRMLSSRAQRRIPRLQLVGVQSYLAENAMGMPEAADNAKAPIYLGGQFRFEIAPMEDIEYADTGEVLQDINGLLEIRGALGMHWYESASVIAENLGVGYLEETTNSLDDRGRLRSKFLIGEAYAEVIVLRTQRARVRAWFHGLYNFNAKSMHEDTGKRKDAALEAGASWGMENLTDRWDFILAFRYVYIQADALIPQFNNEVYNTNIRGYEISLHVNVLPTVTFFGIFGLTNRENYEANGFGYPSPSREGRSSGQSLRLRLGLFMIF